ncbi:MAG: hypothetical protein Q7J48_00555 [Nocardioides sp.]|nr:hypothetical protein [Nocardioides sp.]
MNRSDRVLRAVSLTLAVLCFLVVPQLAFGQFSSETAPTMNVGTIKLLTPADVTGSYECRSKGKNEMADVAVTGFAVPGQPVGVSYTYTLYRGTTPHDTETTPAEQASLSTGWQGTDRTDTTYRLTIVTKLGSWTAPEYSTTFICRS